ncbi:hypothetical protein KQH81_10875 [Clostridium cadaveris]|uniref:hypothetical protein n=1 Tax=Clostridium TaxID=1485 RepID=UPI001E5FE3DB|nr:hypothetical protein [Clostridium cadaveris]MDU4953486.1 hypothetical protein [Clostridium sp.]UFH63857.1 hypothetical protein KQH81_10875 [Clostridium cadaveris]
MLESKESISITGESKIEGKTVVSLIANITTEEGTYPSVSTTVLDRELYSANLEACQADITAFNTRVFEKQKQVLGGIK